MDRENFASNRMDVQELVSMRGKEPSGMKLGYFSLWWLRMAREATIQGENKSMKKMTTYFQLNKIQNVSLDSQVIRNYQSDKRTPPVGLCAQNDVIKGCPPTQQSTSLASSSISTPSKGVKRTFKGEHNDSPAKQNKVCLQLVNEASQNSNILLKDTNYEITTQVQTKTKQTDLINDGNLKKMAAILASETLDISLEERGDCTDDHKC